MSTRNLSSILIFTLITFSIPTGYSQDLHIYYSVPNDSMSYVLRYPDGRSKLVNSPIVRKGGHVVLHVNDYNNYLYQLEVKQSIGIPEQIMQTQGASGWSPGIDKAQPVPFLNFLQGVIPNIPVFNTQMSAFADGGTTLRQEIILKSEQLVQTLNGLKRSTSSIQTSQDIIKKQIDDYLVEAFVFENVDQLIYDPRLSPAQIKQLYQEYMNKIFSQPSPSDITLSRLIEKAQSYRNINTFVSKYKGEIETYETAIAKAKENKSAIEPLRRHSPDDLGSYLDNIDLEIKKLEGNLSLYNKNLQELEASTQALEVINMDNLANFRKRYLTLIENDFSSTVRQLVSTDQMDLQLSFIPIDSNIIKGMKSTSVTPIPIKVYGGLQINTSIGLGFGRFFEQPLNYFVRDSTIAGIHTDAFIPQLTSLVSFYRQGKNDLSLGGSLGIGFPLNGGNGLESVTFYFGPSIILGHNRRIFINTGFMGGRVHQLSDGYAVGDRFSLPENFLKTQANYKIGYYLGISFNLININ